jgi:hypothetical protein
MDFLDPSSPITTCEATDCAGCSVAGSVQCHFGPEDLIHFYLICFPAFLVGGAALFSSGWIPFLIWVGIFITFFGFVEIRVMCSHCPHYAEEKSSLRCWANYGSPKLWFLVPSRDLRTSQCILLHDPQTIPLLQVHVQVHELRVSPQQRVGFSSESVLGTEPCGGGGLGIPKRRMNRMPIRH